ncbi:hypothetical protein BJ508DRAFT_329286 [Ascobolus immersus RN42]|uniref:F-box domain-containing protein n=1 Tax=Ascobolus immersus RN42 TaxID=1160509 RepID=A0A3N4HZ15_ASCIM|nr:hypothetical protein BJ508DRAFT_329286 [Ascobolus immersus RN42]
MYNTAEPTFPTKADSDASSCTSSAADIPSFDLLRLPTELRIEVYRHCTTFTLLNLSHTSRSLHAEINSCPQIITASKDYRPASNNYSRPVPLDNPAYWAGLMLYFPASEHESPPRALPSDFPPPCNGSPPSPAARPATSPPPSRQSLAPGTATAISPTRLTNYNIASVSSIDEVVLFNDRYVKGDIESYRNGRRIVCPRCWRVAVESVSLVYLTSFYTTVCWVNCGCGPGEGGMYKYSSQ